jgi:UDP-glucose 4-epimerase
MIKDNSKILVTGGCGFIGSNLIPMLEKKGYKVRVLDNFSKGNPSFIQSNDVEIVKGDIRNIDDVQTALAGVSGVIHLAAYGSVVESVVEPLENFEINVRGTFNILNECRKIGINKIIFSSTGGALIGNAIPPVNEKSIPKPISPYGPGKLCCEAYCSSFSESYGMNIIALRFANVIGPISWHKKGAITAFMKSIINNKDIVIYGDGCATRDFLYVDDLCKGIILAYNSDIIGFNPIHLSSGVGVSVSELANMIIQKGPKSDSKIQYMPKRVGEVERNFANYDLAKKMLGFQPEISLDMAIEKTWKWFQSYNKVDLN